MPSEVPVMRDLSSRGSRGSSLRREHKGQSRESSWSLRSQKMAEEDDGDEESGGAHSRSQRWRDVLPGYAGFDGFDEPSLSLEDHTHGPLSASAASGPHEVSRASRASRSRASRGWEEPSVVTDQSADGGTSTEDEAWTRPLPMISFKAACAHLPSLGAGAAAGPAGGGGRFLLVVYCKDKVTNKYKIFTKTEVGGGGRSGCRSPRFDRVLRLNQAEVLPCACLCCAVCVCV